MAAVTLSAWVWSVTKLGELLFSYSQAIISFRDLSNQLLMVLSYFFDVSYEFFEHHNRPLLFSIHFAMYFTYAITQGRLIYSVYLVQEISYGKWNQNATFRAPDRCLKREITGCIFS